MIDGKYSLVFDPIIINGVWVHPETAFSDNRSWPFFTAEDKWGQDLVGRVFPELGESYMKLLLDMGGDIKKCLVIFIRRGEACWENGDPVTMEALK